MDFVELSYVTISKLNKNTIKTIYSLDCELNLKRLEETRLIYTEMYGDEDLSNLKLMIVFQGAVKFDLDQGKQYMLTRLRNKIGEVYITKNPFNIMYMKSVIQIIKAKHPIKICGTESEGMAWLSSL